MHVRLEQRAQYSKAQHSSELGSTSNQHLHPNDSHALHCTSVPSRAIIRLPILIDENLDITIEARFRVAKNYTNDYAVSARPLDRSLGEQVTGSEITLVAARYHRIYLPRRDRVSLTTNRLCTTCSDNGFQRLSS